MAEELPALLFKKKTSQKTEARPRIKTKSVKVLKQNNKKRQRHTSSNLQKEKPSRARVQTVRVLERQSSIGKGGRKQASGAQKPSARGRRGARRGSPRPISRDKAAPLTARCGSAAPPRRLCLEWLDCARPASSRRAEHAHCIPGAPRGGMLPARLRRRAEREFAREAERRRGPGAGAGSGGPALGGARGRAALHRKRSCRFATPGEGRENPGSRPFFFFPGAGLKKEEVRNPSWKQNFHGI